MIVTIHYTQFMLIVSWYYYTIFISIWATNSIKRILEISFLCLYQNDFIDKKQNPLSGFYIEVGKVITLFVCDIF